MKINYILLWLMSLTAVELHAQTKNNKKGESPAMATLSVQQQTSVREINKRYIEEMKVLLKQPVQNPKERKEKIQKMRFSRDSTLKSLLGGQTYADYMKKALIKR